MTAPPQVSPEPPDGTPVHIKRWRTWIVALAWLVGLVLQFSPGIADLTGYAPPYFPLLSGFGTSLGAIIVMIWSYHHENDNSKLLNRALTYFIFAVVILGVYLVLLEHFTVKPPTNRKGARRQIGFYMWVLTDEAEEKIESAATNDPPFEVVTPNDLMGLFRVWGGKGRIDQIWPIWSIWLTGSIMFVFFIGGFFCWARSLGILIRFFNPPDS